MEAREAILGRLAAFEEAEGHSDPDVALDFDPAVSDDASWLGRNIKDWPMWGECMLAAMDGQLPSLARTIDGSDHRAALRSHADYGCVQFGKWTPTLEADWNPEQGQLPR